MYGAFVPRNVAEAYAASMGITLPDTPDEEEAIEHGPPLPPPPPVPRITAYVRTTRALGLAAPLMVVEKREGPVLLTVTDGVYFGSLMGGSSSGSHCWFVFWDEILTSTIPLSEAPAGHPLA
jgi:hypothetical protein